MGVLYDLSDFYKDFNLNVDQKVFEKLIYLYSTKVPATCLPANLSNINFCTVLYLIWTELLKNIFQNYEFDVPAKLVDLYKIKNYGAYGEKGKISLFFIATNLTSKGNSGSRAIDSKGNLIWTQF